MSTEEEPRKPPIGTFHVDRFIEYLLPLAPTRAVFNEIVFDVHAGDTHDDVYDRFSRNREEYQAKSRAAMAATVERCACDESLALRAELAAIRLILDSRAAQLRLAVAHIGNLLSATVPSARPSELERARDEGRVFVGEYMARTP